MHFQILVLNGVFDTGFSALRDTLNVANLLGAGKISNTINCVGLTEKVATANGLAVPTTLWKKSDSLPDVLIVPAMGCLDPQSLSTALQSEEAQRACELIASYRAQGVQIATACTGTFVVAQSGVLNGLSSTTTWWLEPLFREKFPKVKLDASKMVVPQKGVVTAGAALGHVDLALWLVRQQSPDLADTCARYLLFSDRMMQSSFAMADHLMHNDPMVTKFETWARENLEDFSIETAAKAVGVSQRTLQRRIQSVLGRTPIAYVKDLRVQRAVFLLRTSKESVDSIAEKVGYSDAGTLRTVLRKSTGKGVRELRSGF